MANKMLVDAAYPEEIRVAVVKKQKLDELDFENQEKQQLKGNIYLARVTRVEPSLQAAFVDFGGNRHGFLPFSEIHPDYYQIPLADRQALLAEEEARYNSSAEGDIEQAESASSDPQQDTPAQEEEPSTQDNHDPENITPSQTGTHAQEEDALPEDALPDDDSQQDEHHTLSPMPLADDAPAILSQDVPESDTLESDQNPEENRQTDDENPVDADEDQHDEMLHSSVGDNDDDVEEDIAEVAVSRPQNFRRHYKINEVIKRQQILLIQVVKEERGTKGAALTTYLSLAGRYSVLMPNTGRGGGISRKITNGNDRKRLREIASSFVIPQGMGVILRTAGARRTKSEIQRDFEYLLRLWESVRNLTLQSNAPSMIYEEGNLIKRSIRDLYAKDIDEVLVQGEEAYKEAKAFMKMLMPSHAKFVRHYKEKTPIMTRFNVESQMDALYDPVISLPSGGYIVINQTEALVAIDVNSGRATRQHSIEETALRTNLEAAEEVARQLRLRDMAGLVVIDFIDMDEWRNIREVERKFRDFLKSDRARIQIGRISNFGLLEMSRQRLRNSVLEDSSSTCPVCHGAGIVRAHSSVALHMLRSLENLLARNAKHNLIIHSSSDIVLHMLNAKRQAISQIEQKFGILIAFQTNESLDKEPYIIAKGTTASKNKGATASIQVDSITPYEEENSSEENADEREDNQEKDKNKRSKRRTRKNKTRPPETADKEIMSGDISEQSDDLDENDASDTASGEGEQEAPKKRRRRGRRGANRDSDASTKTKENAKPGEDKNNTETAVLAEMPENAQKEIRAENQPEQPEMPAQPEIIEDEKQKPKESATEAEESKEKQSKRSGWWQRRSFF